MKNIKKLSFISLFFVSGIVNAQNIDTLNINQLEEAVVTANKKEENIIKVNTSVTSLNSKKIENSNIFLFFLK